MARQRQTLEVREAGSLEVWKSGSCELANFGTSELRKLTKLGLAPNHLAVRSDRPLAGIMVSVIEPVLAPEGNYDKRICHTVGALVAELAETDHGHAPDYEPEAWIAALRVNAAPLLAYDADTDATIEPAKSALHWVADNLSALRD